MDSLFESQDVPEDNISPLDESFNSDNLKMGYNLWRINVILRSYTRCMQAEK